jgi:hypothetical protein
MNISSSIELHQPNNQPKPDIFTNYLNKSWRADLMILVLVVGSPQCYRPFRIRGDDYFYDPLFSNWTT